MVRRIPIQDDDPNHRFKINMFTTRSELQKQIVSSAIHYIPQMSVDLLNEIAKSEESDYTELIKAAKAEIQRRSEQEIK